MSPRWRPATPGGGGDSELKWILPPEGSEAYDAAKRFAESMGLDTVDHEDFSYPGR